MLDLRIHQRCVQFFDTRMHHRGLVRSNADPEQMNAFGKCLRIGQRSVKVGLRIESSAAAHHLHRRPAEPSNVREHLQVIERNLEGLHASHRKARHRAVIAVGNGSEVRIDIGNQNPSQIVFKRQRTLLHRLHHLGRAEGFSRQVGRRVTGPPGVTAGHHNDHRLRRSGRD